jgi:hypothetical protein
METRRLLAALASFLFIATGCGEVAEPDEGAHDDLGVVEGDLTVASPVPGRGIGTPFGKKGDLWAAGYHTGDDYPAPRGERVVSTRDGRVVSAGWNTYGSAYGLQVMVDSGSIRHLYAHLSGINVRAGDTIKQGDRIGSVGDSGNAFGTHLHYEERGSPYGYWDHRKPQYNHMALNGGYLNWRFQEHTVANRGLQRALVSTGCGVGRDIDDFYGDDVREAVRCFQRKQGWSGADADGLLGPMTAELLFLTGDVHVSELHAGVRNSRSVRLLQQRLNEVLGMQLAVNGDYFEETRAAARTWQLRIGDSGRGADGNIGPMQASQLFNDRRYDIH